MDVDELQHALGGVVLESAFLERVLRAAFSALIDSKYAAVVDSRLTAATMIEDCHAWTTRPGDVTVTLHSSRNSHDVTVTVRTPAEVRQVADRLADAASDVKAAMTAAFGPEWDLVEDQLRQEGQRPDEPDESDE
jgi:hypothetical protein